ncbi:MAG: hypothetical protein WCI74_04560 [Actinomycetes bacterium]
MNALGVGTVALTLLLVGCSSGGNASPSTDPASPSGSQTPNQLEQYAVGATATSSYGEKEGSAWNASNAVGAPTVHVCADDGAAWASLNKNTVDSLQAKFQEPVIPTSVSVYQNYNPGYVTEVSVSGAGKSAVVYSGAPAPQSSCPSTLTVPISKVDFLIDFVSVTVDQRTLNNWSEIDAVKLVGTVPSNTGLPR